MDLFDPKDLDIIIANLEYLYYVGGIEECEKQILHLRNNGFNNASQKKTFYIQLIKFASKLLRADDVDNFVNKVIKLGFFQLGFTQAALIIEYVDKRDKEMLKKRLSVLSRKFGYKNGDMFVLMDILKAYSEKRKIDSAIFLYENILFFFFYLFFCFFICFFFILSYIFYIFCF